MVRAGCRAVAAVVVLLAAVSSSAWAQERVPVGQLAAGTSGLVLRGGEARKPLIEGDFLFEGDRVHNAPSGSGLLIVFPDRSTLAIGAASEVVIQRFRAGSGGVRQEAAIALVTGILRVTVEDSRRRAPFVVRSPAAVASARATDWVVVAEPDRSAVFVVEGRVAVSAPGGGSIALAAGYGSDVLAGRAPGRPERWGEPRVRALLDRSRVANDLEESHQVIQ